MPLFGCASDEQFRDELFEEIRVRPGCALPDNSYYAEIAKNALIGNMPERENKPYSDYIREYFNGI